MWLFNFWTKKQKEKIQNFWANQVRQAVNNMTDEQKAQVNQIAENTKNQNFDAAAYNKQARENWEADWQNAYRRDILNINDNPQETEAEKKRRLFQENQAKQEAEYQKRIAEDPNTSVEAWLQNVWDLNRLNISQEAKNAELARRNWQTVQNQTTQNPSQTVQNPVQTVQNQQTVNPEQNKTQSINQNNWVVNTAQNTVNQAQTAGNVDYNTWDVAWWKSRGSSKEELENAIEKKYWTVADWKEDWSLEAVINGQKFKWTIDANWNPVKTNLWSVSQTDMAKNNFNQMLQNGISTEELNKYVYSNNLQDDPNIKKQLSQKFLDDYEKPIIEKYKNLGLKEIHEAVENWELVPGSETFNKLPQAEGYMKVKDSFAIINANKKKDYTAYNAALDIEKIVDNHLNKFFDTSWIKEIADNYKNDTQLKEYQNDIYRRQNNIEKLQAQIKDVWEYVRWSMRWSSESAIQAEIANRTQSLMNAVAHETGLMNSSAKMIDLKKQDLEVQMWFLKYSDWMKKEQYTAGLDLYKSELWRADKEKYYKMDQEWEEKKFKLQEESNRIAREHNNELQKNLLSYQIEIKKWEWNFVKYPNWVYFQKNDWTMKLVMKWEDLWIVPDSQYDIHPYKRDDGWITYSYVNKKTWEMWVYSLDAFWNEILQYSWSWTDFRKYAKLYVNEASLKNNNTSWITWNSNFDNPTPWSTAKLLLDNWITYKKWTPRPSNEWWYYVAFDSAEDWIKAQYIMLASSKQTVRERLKSWVWIWDTNEYAKEVFWNSWLDKSLLDTPLNRLTPNQLQKLQLAQIQRESPWFYKSMIKEWWIQDWHIVLPTKKQEKTIKPLDKDKFTQSQSIINDFRNDKAVTAFNSALDSWKDLLTSLEDSSWAGDMSAIFQFMKTLDPSSVVRESEFELAWKTSWVTEQWWMLFTKLQKWERLTEQQRQNFKKLAIQYISNKAQNYNEVYKNYSDRYKFQIWDDYFKINFPTNRAEEFDQRFNVKRKQARQIVEEIKKKKEMEANPLSRATYNSIRNIF